MRLRIVLHTGRAVLRRRLAAALFGLVFLSTAYRALEAGRTCLDCPVADLPCGEVLRGTLEAVLPIRCSVTFEGARVPAHPVQMTHPGGELEILLVPDTVPLFAAIFDSSCGRFIETHLFVPGRRVDPVQVSLPEGTYTVIIHPEEPLRGAVEYAFTYEPHGGCSEPEPEPVLFRGFTFEADGAAEPRTGGGANDPLIIDLPGGERGRIRAALGPSRSFAAALQAILPGDGFGLHITSTFSGVDSAAAAFFTLADEDVSFGLIEGDTPRRVDLEAWNGSDIVDRATVDAAVRLAEVARLPGLSGTFTSTVSFVLDSDRERVIESSTFCPRRVVLRGGEKPEVFATTLRAIWHDVGALEGSNLVAEIAGEGVSSYSVESAHAGRSGMEYTGLANSAVEPAIGAPGVTIRSRGAPEEFFGFQGVVGSAGGLSSSWGGTSMAAPHTAGVAALLKLDGVPGQFAWDTVYEWRGPESGASLAVRGQSGLAVEDFAIVSIDGEVLAVQPPGDDGFLGGASGVPTGFRWSGGEPFSDSGPLGVIEWDQGTTLSTPGGRTFPNVKALRYRIGGGPSVGAINAIAARVSGISDFSFFTGPITDTIPFAGVTHSESGDAELETTGDSFRILPSTTTRAPDSAVSLRLEGLEGWALHDLDLSKSGRGSIDVKGSFQDGPSELATLAFGTEGENASLRWFPRADVKRSWVNFKRGDTTVATGSYPPGTVLTLAESRALAGVRFDSIVISTTLSSRLVTSPVAVALPQGGEAEIDEIEFKAELAEAPLEGLANAEIHTEDAGEVSWRSESFVNYGAEFQVASHNTVVDASKGELVFKNAVVRPPCGEAKRPARIDIELPENTAEARLVGGNAQVRARSATLASILRVVGVGGVGQLTITSTLSIANESFGSFFASPGSSFVALVSEDGTRREIDPVVGLSVSALDAPLTTSFVDEIHVEVDPDDPSQVLTTLALADPVTMDFGAGVEVARGIVSRAAQPEGLPARPVGLGLETSGYESFTIRDVIAEAATGGEVRFVRGDANSDGGIDISDGIGILGYLYLGTEAPACMDAAHASDSGRGLALTDAIYIFNWLFQGGTVPPPPSPSTSRYAAGECGVDPTPDGLGCETPAPVCAE